MFCTKCGHSNSESAAYCSSCGSPLADQKLGEAAPLPQTPIPPQDPIMSPPYAPAASQNQQGYCYGVPQQPYPPRGAYSTPKKKSRTGVILGLTVGGVVLIAAVLLLVWPGFLVQSAPVNGFWYSEDRGEALEFRSNNSVRVYTTYDKLKGDYTYDRIQGLGMISVEDDDYRFAVTGDDLYVESMGKYTQAEDNFDVEDFIDDASEAFKEVASAQTDSNDDGQIVAGITDIQGLWYETTGYGGTIEFYTNGTYNMTIVGYVFGGTYEFDASAGTGMLYEKNTDETYPVTMSNGMLETDGYQYTRDYVEQYDWDDTENLD